MISTTSEYALRALVNLAREPAASWLLGHELAKRAEIPANYLAKIMWTLRNAGYVETARGHGGGYRLTKPADKISILDVVRLFDGINAEPGCLLGENLECSDKNACSAHAAWKSVKEAYVEFMRTKTIAVIRDGTMTGRLALKQARVERQAARRAATKPS